MNKQIKEKINQSYLSMINVRWYTFDYVFDYNLVIVQLDLEKKKKNFIPKNVLLIKK